MALLALAVGAGRAGAGVMPVPLEPGSSADLLGTTYQTPPGRVVAQTTLPFTVRYQPDGSFVDFSGTAVGQLVDTVLRDPSTGHLTFVYHIDLSNEAVTSASEGSTLTVGAFAPYHTAVSGQLQFQQVAPIERSGDGSTLRFFSGAPGLGGPPELAVTTNATKFDANGSATYALGDEFQVNGPTGRELDAVWGQVMLKGVFRPTGTPAVSGGGTGNPGGPTAVPLPPAAYTGLGVLAGCALISAGRRALNRRA